MKGILGNKVERKQIYIYMAVRVQGGEEGKEPKGKDSYYTIRAGEIASWNQPVMGRHVIIHFMLARQRRRVSTDKCGVSSTTRFLFDGYDFLISLKLIIIIW